MDNNNTPAGTPQVGLFFGILAVSTASIFIRFAQGEAPSLLIAAGRMLGATLLLFPFAIRHLREDLKKVSGRTISFLVTAGIFLGMHFATWITSLEYTSVASSVVLVTTAPLWVALLSPVLLKEKVKTAVFLGLAISMLGSIMVGMSTLCNLNQSSVTCLNLSKLFEGNAFWGNLLALAGAFLSAGYLMIGRHVRHEVSLLSYTFMVYGVAAVSLLFMLALSGVVLRPYTAQTWFWIFLLALIPQVLGHSTFNYFLKKLSAAFVSVALLGEPVGTVLLAFLFLGESPTPLEICGGILILAGIAAATLSNTKKLKTA